MRACVKLDIEDNSVRAILAQVEDGEYSRICFSKQDERELIGVLSEIVRKHAITFKPRFIVPEDGLGPLGIK